LMLVAAHPWVGRCRGIIITAISSPGCRPPLVSWRGVHRGRTASSLLRIGSRRIDGPPLRGPCLLRPILVDEANEALDSRSPLLHLLRSRREIEEQLRTCQSFRWHRRR
jgi:hypothetical protein